MANGRLFSVIIPTRNRPAMLERALKSLAGQTFSDYEVIIVNDGNMALSPDVFKIVPENLLRVYNTNVRRGAGNARNIGASHANGRLLAFLDDDDEYFPSFLQRSAEQLLNTDSVVGLSCTHVLYRDYAADGAPEGGQERLVKISPYVPGDPDALLSFLRIGAGFGITFKAEVFRAIGGFDVSFRITEDTDLLYTFCAAGYVPTVIQTPQVRIHNHAGGRLSSWANDPDRIAECHRLIRKHSCFLGCYSFVLQGLETHIGNLHRRSNVTA